MQKSTRNLAQVLICDDDSLFHMAVKHALKGQYDCRSAMNSDEALIIVKNQPIDVVLLDVQMRTPDEGLKAIPILKDADPDLAIIMSSGLSDFKTIKEAFKSGASDYISKDFDPNEIIITLNRVLEKRSLLQLNEQRNFEVRSSQNRYPLIGESPAIQILRKTIEKVRVSHASVIIEGETGTGKEVVARQLRKTLPDGSFAPFVSVDSSTIQSTMAESILFGHEKGAFTGAEKSMKGIFEEAHGGTVYFDEIANMPLDIQAKLLRVLQEKEVSRLGSSKVISLEFRVICATNKNLDEMVKAGQFKEDLLQRLNVLPIVIPPLRQRKEDIEILAKHFIKRDKTGSMSFTSDALAVLQEYSWPGNVRELSNVVSYLIAMTEGTEIDVSDLPPKLRDQSHSPQITNSASGEGFYIQVAAFEREILSRKYNEHGGNVSQMALALGMDRSHLYTKLREFEIHRASAKKKSD